MLISEKVSGQQNKCEEGAKYWKLFSASGFHGMDFIIVDAGCENPAGSEALHPFSCSALSFYFRGVVSNSYSFVCTGNTILSNHGMIWFRLTFSTKYLLTALF